MKRNIYFSLFLGFVLSLTGCISTLEPKDYTLFRESDPRGILIVPVINRSVNVDAPDYFLSTIAKPIAERGYYVYPVNLVKRVLEDDGLSDVNLVHASDCTRLAEIFGADAILYVTIERWDAQYAILSTSVTVEFTYILKCGKTGKNLWTNTERMVYTPNNSNSSGNALADLIASAISAAITKAAPNYIPLTQQANAKAVSLPHQGLPAGPYSTDYKKDLEKF